MRPIKIKRDGASAPHLLPPNGDGAPTAVPATEKPAVPAPTAKGGIHLLDHPIAHHTLAALRNRQTPPEQFRQHCQRLLLFLVMEATRALPTREQSDETTAGVRAAGRALGKPVVLLSMARHGMGLAHQMAEYIPESVTGVINLTDGEAGAPEARLHLVRAPALNEARVILFAPVVATGLTSCLALNLLRRFGATDTALLSVVVSSAALMRIQATDPAVSIWTAAVDSGWDAKLGPLPGIGNFAERFFG